MPRGQLYSGFAICIQLHGYIYFKIINYSFKWLFLIAVFLFKCNTYHIYIYCVYFYIISAACGQFWEEPILLKIMSPEACYVVCVYGIMTRATSLFVLIIPILNQLVFMLCILKKPSHLSITLWILKREVWLLMELKFAIGMAASAGLPRSRWVN